MRVQITVVQVVITCCNTSVNAGKVLYSVFCYALVKVCLHCQLPSSTRALVCEEKLQVLKLDWRYSNSVTC